MKFEVHIHGKVPEVLDEIEAPSRNAAIAIATNIILERLMITPYPKDQWTEPDRPSTPEAKKRRSARRRGKTMKKYVIKMQDGSYFKGKGMTIHSTPQVAEAERFATRFLALAAMAEDHRRFGQAKVRSYDPDTGEEGP